MRGRHTPLFATTGDLGDIIQEISTERPVAIFEMGLFNDEHPRRLENALEMQYASHYILMDAGLELVVRQVPQKDGTVKYAVDPMRNQSAVVLHHCGRTDDRLTPGSIDVAADDDRAQRLYAMFAKAIRRRFERIHSFYVGPEASRLFTGGLRLVLGGHATTEHDLQRP